MDDVFFELHSNLPREGPGSDETTRRAFEMLPERFNKPLILDIGCGPGMQTLELARCCQGEIIAIDNHQPYVDDLNHKITKKRLSHRVTAANRSMFELDFKNKTFDIIWAEGVIYLFGFAEGLKEWKRYLKDEGFLVVSEISWLKSKVPQEIKNFWTESYSGMKDINENLKIIDKCRYNTVGV